MATFTASLLYQSCSDIQGWFESNSWQRQLNMNFTSNSVHAVRCSKTTKRWIIRLTGATQQCLDETLRHRAGRIFYIVSYFWLECIFSVSIIKTGKHVAFLLIYTWPTSSRSTQTHHINSSPLKSYHTMIKKGMVSGISKLDRYTFTHFSGKLHSDTARQYTRVMI